MVDCQIRPSDVTKYPIIEAMLAVRREAFVPAKLRGVAYAGEHISLSSGRVVLDPRVLAKMLDSLNIQRSELVLNVGCSLGYGTAVMAHMADFVVGVESDAEMAAEAQSNLMAQSVDNATVVNGALEDGAAKYGPYDVIVIEGSVADVPQSLCAQLRDGGQIAAIFRNGAMGQCRVGLKTAGKINWRVVFDATAPMLPGFVAAAEFEF